MEKLLTGFIEDTPDKRDVPLFGTAMKWVTNIIPCMGLKEVDWSDYATDVKDQGPDGACFTEGTEVLTKSGWKNWNKVTYEDDLATVNKENHLEFQHPLKLHKYEHTDKIISVNSNTLDFEVTKDHRMYVRKWDSAQKKLKQNYEFCNAEDLGWYSGILAAPKFFSGLKKEYVDINGIQILTEDFMKFLGIYLSEGWSRNREAAYKHNLYESSVCVFKEQNYEIIKKLLSKLPLPFKESSGRKGVFHIRNKKLYDYLYEYGGLKAWNKKIPDDLMCLDYTNHIDFLNYFCMGDGHINANGRRSFYTTSEVLANQLQESMLRVGKRSFVKEYGPKNSDIDGRLIEGKRNTYTINEWMSDQLSIDRKKQLREKEYSGYVYCATVPNGTLITRRNGKILISGNCVGFATVAALEALYLKHRGNKTDLSEEMIYNIAREYDVFPGFDHSGTTIRSAVKVLEKFGVCEENYYPYNPYKKVNPKRGYLKNAKQYRISSYKTLTIGNSIKANYVARALKTSPVIAGFMISEKFSALSSLGIIKEDMVNNPAYGHAMCVMGYDTEKKQFLIRNSWGVNWGDKGYCYMPESLLEKSILSAWTIEL